MTTEETHGADADRWADWDEVGYVPEEAPFMTSRGAFQPNARVFADGSLEWYAPSPRMAVREALAKLGVQAPPAPDTTFGGVKMPRVDLGEAIKQHDEDARTLAALMVDTSPMTRVVQAHAKKVVEQIDEALVRALQHTDNFEVHVYEWSTWSGDGEHKVVFNAAVQIVVKADGGPEIIRHPYGEEPLHDERRD